MATTLLLLDGPRLDRLLMAQASHAGLRRLTADRVLLGLGREFVVDATK